MQWLTTSILPFLFLACGEKDTGFPEEDYIEGSSAGDCTDDFDNDFDGLTDCEDDGCSEHISCISEGDQDQDEDGFTPNEGDCDDFDDSVYPGASDEWYDGVDSDCAGNSDYDQDQDGQDSSAHGGTDCNDTDTSEYFGAMEIWYDGIDQNCDGASDYDQDGDGDDALQYGGTDCDDTNALIGSSSTEIYYDGVDQNCDGSNDFDADGDDNVNINGEWIKVENISSSTINLEGYQLHSEPLGSDHYYFEESTPLKAGESLYLYVGSGKDSALEKYWNKDTGILANSSDRVWLDTLDGKLISEYSWSDGKEIQNNYTPEQNNGLVQEDIAKLYVSIFNRASEKPGVDYWLTQKSDKTAAEIADEMLATDAAKSYFGSSLNSNESFVEHIYTNTLNKSGENVDATGKAYWVSLLEDGTPRGEMVSTMINAISTYAPGEVNYDSNDSTTIESYNQFMNRVEVANFAAEELNYTPSNYGEVLSFSGDLTVTGVASTASIAKLYINEQLI